ncbi:piggyBac transposable element-derived protein 4-like [Macrosteles quadrilineatus]|uniref:piggyBac transposable element-derived protein 4-like n=1 Tax=Macrosteles quadrilineatus TaxID=74068 RepID=UPI0023E1F131|nr:piggyBac transposable element-derived protein 4-like [Macrosteles quadrilineatus]
MHILPYVGAETNLEFPDILGVGITGRVVLTLLEPYFGLGHKVYLDNWYVSPSLAMQLYKHNTNMCGTVLPDRQGLPKKLPKLEVGQVDVHHTDVMSYERWQDKREVRVLSTMHNSEMLPTGKTNWETGQMILKPKSVLDYNLNMGAVDIGDMELSFNVTARKSIKWYKKLFFHFFDVAIRNAHILKKVRTGTTSHLSEFRKELVREILELHNPTRAKPQGGRPSPGETPLRLTQRHFPEPIPPTDKNPRPRRKCHVCKHTTRQPPKRQDTYYMCRPCGEVPLCVHPCMKDFHTLRHF